MKKLLILISIITLASCADKTQVMPNPSGRAGEVLIVMNDKHWESESGQIIKKTFNQDVPGLAWSEPTFDISRLPRGAFNDMVRIARNIVEVEVGDRYSSGKVKYFKEQYSRTQAYVKIQAPDEASLLELVKANKDNILNYFIKAERDRLMSYFAKNKSNEYTTKVKELMGYEMTIPSMFNHHNFSGKDFIWLSGGNVDARTDLALYTLPCNDETIITKDFLIAKRDSVMKINIPGPSKGAYVRTADVVSPTFNKVIINKTELYELRGLWETTVDFMGGPFVSYAYYDKENKTIKVFEGFIYAPHEDKRNLLNRIDAVVYSWKPAAVPTDKTEK